MTRAKFRVVSVRRSLWNRGQEVQTIELTPVIDGSEENKEFYAATPSGKIELGVLNAKAAADFDIGAEFYVDFTKV